MPFLSLSLLSVSSLFLSLSLSLALSPPGILYGTMTLELGGQITIACEKTGYSAQLEFKLKVRQPQPLPLFLQHKSSANMAASCHHQLHSCPKKIPHPSICQFIHPSIHLCTDPLCDSATGAENRGEKWKHSNIQNKESCSLLKISTSRVSTHIESSIV